jgi:chromosome segregation ATPase
MENIFPSVRDHLFEIACSVFGSMKNDLLFPRRRKTPEELLQDKVRIQFSLIRSLQDQLSTKDGTIRKLRLKLQDKMNLLDLKDKEIERLNERIRSLELELSQRTNRHKGGR